MLKESGSFIAAAATGFLVYFIHQGSAKFKIFMHQKWFNRSLKRSIELKLQLAGLKSKVGAERIYLWQFHNGKVFVGDNSFHKYYISAIFEIVNQGLSREMHDMQNIPMSKYAELLYYMIKENENITVVGDHHGADVSFKDADLENDKYTTNSKTIVFVKVYSKNKTFVGLIVMFFTDEIDRSKFIEDALQSVELNTLLFYLKNKI